MKTKTILDPHPCHRQGPIRRTRRFWVWLVLVLPLLGSSLACNDDLFKVRWTENPDTANLYSLARPELNLLSAFDFVNRVPIRVESPDASGRWEMVLDTQDGELVLLPPGALGVVGTRARIIPMGPIPYEEVLRAPSDTTLYVADEPVPVVVGNTYVIRTRQAVGVYGQRCVYYGKFEALTQDPVEGTFSFVFDVSPVCNSRKLYPTNK